MRPAILVTALLWAAIGALAGCPRLPPQSGCAPETQRCDGDFREVCSATGRWHRAGDLSCAAVGGSCLVAQGRAFCGVADAAPGDVGLTVDAGTDGGAP